MKTKREIADHMNQIFFNREMIQDRYVNPNSQHIMEKVKKNINKMEKTLEIENIINEVENENKHRLTFLFLKKLVDYLNVYEFCNLTGLSRRQHLCFYASLSLAKHHALSRSLHECIDFVENHHFHFDEPLNTFEKYCLKTMFDSIKTIDLKKYQLF